MNRARPIGVCLVPLALAGCSAFKPPDEQPAPPDLTFEHLQAEQYRSGDLTSRSTYATLAYERNLGRVQAQQVVYLPAMGSDAGAKLVAARGTGSTKSGIALLEGGVTYDTPSGDHIETAACTVDFFRRVATGDRPVQLRGDGYRVEAAAFESSFAKPSDVQLLGGVRALVDTGLEPSAPEPVQTARHRTERGR